MECTSRCGTCTRSISAFHPSPPVDMECTRCLHAHCAERHVFHPSPPVDMRCTKRSKEMRRCGSSSSTRDPWWTCGAPSRRRATRDGARRVPPGVTPICEHSPPLSSLTESPAPARIPRRSTPSPAPAPAPASSAPDAAISSRPGLAWARCAGRPNTLGSRWSWPSRVATCRRRPQRSSGTWNSGGDQGSPQPPAPPRHPSAPAPRRGGVDRRAAGIIGVERI